MATEQESNTDDALSVDDRPRRAVGPGRRLGWSKALCSGGELAEGRLHCNGWSSSPSPLASSPPLTTGYSPRRLALLAVVYPPPTTTHPLLDILAILPSCRPHPLAPHPPFASASATPPLHLARAVSLLGSSSQLPQASCTIQQRFIFEPLASNSC
ncbi:hypothetical protein PANT_5d00111 [Moesziomyces antarcticus T-34]|uniref:Uncharacterized protein n=1 Tax=Pseudozyma antarctica (strain T-34) TaxID=1151754 RepID=M9LY02_PSEA3|nr:hypothetical protein PANT_5d00111 [Moesziomyces antarcticus T-34]